MKTNPFKVGDRVRVYSADIPDSDSFGKVIFAGVELVQVLLDNRHGAHNFYWKQCRRLKPKRKSEEVWVRNDYKHAPNDAKFYAYVQTISPIVSGFTRFREVKKK